MVVPLQDLRNEIEEALAPYGGYLLYKKPKEGELKFGIAEVSLAAIILVVWALGQYLKAYLQEKGKMRAMSTGFNRKILETKLDELLTQVRGLKGKYRPQPRVTEKSLNVELQKLGLTKRVAAKAARQIAPVVNSELIKLFTKDKP